MNEPIRDPKSKALIYPQQDDAMDLVLSAEQSLVLLHSKVVRLQGIVQDLIEFTIGLPKPAGTNITLTHLLERVKEINTV